MSAWAILRMVFTFFAGVATGTGFLADCYMDRVPFNEFEPVHQTASIFLPIPLAILTLLIFPVAIEATITGFRPRRPGWKSALGCAVLLWVMGSWLAFGDHGLTL